MDETKMTRWRETDTKWIGKGPDGKELKIDKTVSPLLLTMKPDLKMWVHKMLTPITREDASKKFKISEELATALPEGTIISDGVDHRPNFRIVNTSQS